MAKAEALRGLGRMEEALAASEEQMRGLDQIERQHTEILYEIDKIQELKEFCDRWAKTDGSDDPFVMVNRAKVLFKTGKAGEAVSC